MIRRSQPRGCFSLLLEVFAKFLHVFLWKHRGCADRKFAINLFSQFHPPRVDRRSSKLTVSGEHGFQASLTLCEWCP